MRRLHVQGRRTAMRRMVVGVLAAVLLGFSATGPALAASSPPAPTCHNISGSSHLPMPPQGEWYTATTTLTSNCTLVASQAVLTPDGPTSLAGDAQSSRASIVAGAASGSGDPEATSYYRLWDPANLLLNATYDTLNWSTSGGDISGATTSRDSIWADDGWIESGYGGGFTGGCVGCTSISSMAENWYLFIPAEIYYNWDAAYITGDGNGGYSNCYSAWQWETGFPGWHTQTWCGWGFSG